MKRTIRIIAWLVGLAALLVVAGYGWAHFRSEQILSATRPFMPVTIPIPADAASIDEGRRLATVRGCNGCHGRQLQGELLFDDPKIARIVAPNLTAAARKYDDAQLAGIIKGGVRPDGRSMIVMPSQVYMHMSDGDLGRVIAYVKSMPAAQGPEPSVTLGPLGRIGLATGKFKVVTEEIAQGKAPPDAANATAAARGRYLARSVCAECHGTDLAGKTTPAYVATDLRVVAAYGAGDFSRLLRTGVALGGRELAFMSLVSRNHLSKLNDDEIADLYAYLKALGPMVPG